MHEVSAVRAAIRAAEAACLLEGVPEEGLPTAVRLSVGGHMQPGQIGSLFELLAGGTVLAGASVSVSRDDSLDGELRVDSVVVSRREQA